MRPLSQSKLLSTLLDPLKHFLSLTHSFNKHLMANDLVLRPLLHTENKRE